nr:chaplin [Streptomyces sp. Y2F8-2]
MIAVAAASGAMAVALPAHADSAADGTAAGSPGLISGSTLQVPVHVPVNVCGNTVDVVGLLNPAAGNACENRGAGRSGGGQGAVSGGGATAHTGGKGSSGVLAGNGLQLPVDIPVNVTGNSVSVAGAGNASVGNTSTNTSSTARPAVPPKAHTPVRTAPPVQQAQVTLAHTGADVTLPALAGSGALLLGGTLLYRRFRSSATR